MTPGASPTAAGTWAETWLHPKAANPNAGEDCDIELYTHQRAANGSVQTNSWTDKNPPASPTTMSVALVFRHELGHCLGFQENSVASSVMNASTAGLGDAMPSLSTDDESAVRRVYGP